MNIKDEERVLLAIAGTLALLLLCWFVLDLVVYP